jgi:hypothetical protein
MNALPVASSPMQKVAEAQDTESSGALTVGVDHVLPFQVVAPATLDPSLS